LTSSGFLQTWNGDVTEFSGGINFNVRDPWTFQRNFEQSTVRRTQHSRVNILEATCETEVKVKLALQGCETSRLPHGLDNRLIDSGEVVSITHRPPFIPKKIPGTHFC
jgi:hypothetical protein